MVSNNNFLPEQIVCLENEGSCLYGEVIQIAESGSMFWLRPLMLASWSSGVNPQSGEPPEELYDLREGADLVWPMTGFRAAFDTEVIPLLAALAGKEREPRYAILAHRQLRLFVDRLWESQQKSNQE